MTIKRVFKCRIPNSNFVLASGKNLPFTGGRYITDDPYEIRELMKEIGEEGNGKSKHPHLYVDEKESQIDTTLQDKINKAKAEAVAKVMKEHEAVAGAFVESAEDKIATTQVIPAVVTEQTVDPVTGLLSTAQVVEETPVKASVLPEGAMAKLLSMRAANVGIASSAGNPMVATSGA